MTTSAIQALEQLVEDLAGAATLLELPVAMPTAQAAADACRVPVAAIAKTIVLRCKPSGFVAVVLSGIDRLSQSKVCSHLEMRSVRFASADEVLRETGYPPGGTTPLGLRDAIRVLVDATLLSMDTVFVGGGNPHRLIRLSPAKLVEVTGATVGDFRQNQ